MEAPPRSNSNPGAPETSSAFWDRAQRILMVLLQLRTVIVLVILIFVFASISPVYLSANNLVLMTKHVAITALMAIGMTFVILTAGIDLSVGSIAGLTAMVSGGLIVEGLVLPMFGVAIFYQAWLVILIGLLVGIAVGYVNAVLINRVGITPFIATLGTLYIARGFAQLRSGGNTFPNLAGNPALGNTGFELFGGGRILNVPVPIWLMVFFSLVAIFVLTRTPFGRHVYAIGGNMRTAQLAGIPVKRVITAVYVISGFFAAMAGLIIASELQSGHPATGNTYELTVIAAVVLGGTSLFGGRGTIVGSILGAFVIGFLSDGLVIVGVSSFWQTVIKGAVILAAIAVNNLQAQLQQRRSLQAALKGGSKRPEALPSQNS